MLAIIGGLVWKYRAEVFSYFAEEYLAEQKIEKDKIENSEVSKFTFNEENEIKNLVEKNY